MLPFLKDRHEGGMSAPVEVIERKSDDPEDYGMVDAVVDDLMDAFHKKDKKLLKDAILALIEHIQDLDIEQDQEDMT